MSGPGEVLASVICEFGDEVAAVDGLVVVALDDQGNSGDDGRPKSRFYPGESAFLLVHHSPELRLTGARCSAGAVVDLGGVTRAAEVEQSFDHGDERHELPHLPARLPQAVWLGRDGGLRVDGRQLGAERTPAIGVVRYSFAARRFRLDPPQRLELSGDAEFPIRVVFSLEAA